MAKISPEKLYEKLSLLLADDSKEWIGWGEFEKRMGQVYTKEQRRHFRDCFKGCYRIKGHSTLVNWKKFVEAHEKVEADKEAA